MITRNFSRNVLQSSIERQSIYEIKPCHWKNSEKKNSFFETPTKINPLKQQRSVKRNKSIIFREIQNIELQSMKKMTSAQKLKNVQLTSSFFENLNHST